MKRIDKGIKDEKEGIKYWTHFPMEDLTKEQKREIYQAEKDEKKHLKDLERIKKYKEELGRMG